MKRIRWIMVMVLLLTSGIITKLFSQDLETISDEKSVEISGTLSAFGSYYNVNGIDPRRKDFSWYLRETQF